MIDNNTKYQHRTTLLALGNVEFDILRHTHGRKDMEIVKVETRCMKKIGGSWAGSNLSKIELFAGVFCYGIAP